MNMSPDQKRHTAALAAVRELLIDPDFRYRVSATRTLDLLNWFENVDQNETSLDALVGFMNAIGCKTTWQPGPHGPVMPLLTLGIAEDAGLLPEHLVLMMGTDQDAAVANLASLFSEP